MLGVVGVAQCSNSRIARPLIFPAASAVRRFVDVFEPVTLRDHRVEIEVAVLVPVEELREIAIGLARSADAADETLFVEQHVHRVQFDRRAGNADEHRGAAGVHAEVAGAACGRDLLHRFANADAVEREVHTGDRRFQNGEFVVVWRQLVDRLHRIDLARVDHVRGAEAMREFELRFVEIDRDDRIRAGHACTNDRREADAAHTEDGNALAALHAGGVDHGACAGHYRAADDRGDVARRSRIRFHHVLFVGQREIGPREHVLGLRRAF